MNKLRVHFLIIILLFCFKAYSLETILFGGGGEPEGETTIFDDSLKHLAETQKRMGLKINASFNGGHSTTESILKNQLGTTATDFIPENFQNTIKEYIAKINSGKIKPGENLLVLVDTHGEPTDENAKAETTHDISMAIRGKIRGSRLESMSLLKELANVAKDKKINLGIVDFTCHSGNSLFLANEYTCVVTASSAKLLGYTDFAENFYQSISKGTSLEEVFLKARAESSSQGFPMISTNASKKSTDSILPLLQPYLLYQKGLANKITPYLQEVYESGDVGLCKREVEFEKLVKQVEEFEMVNSVMTNKYLGEQNLLTELKAYKKIQDDILSMMRKNNYGLLKKQEKFFPNPKNTKSVEYVSWQSIIETKPEDIEKFKKYLKESKTKEETKMYQNIISKVEFSLEKKKTILSKHPELNESIKFASIINEKSGELYEKSQMISQIGYKLYDRQYKAEKLFEPKDEKDACRDFKF